MSDEPEKQKSPVVAWFIGPKGVETATVADLLRTSPFISSGITIEPEINPTPPNTHSVTGA